MKQNILKKIILSCITLILPYLLLAQDASQTATSSKSIGMDFNWILLSIAFILLVPLYITSKTFLFALKKEIKRNKPQSNSGKKIGIIIFLLSLSPLSQGKTLNASDISGDWIAWLITSVIFIEGLLIIFFSWQILRMLKPKADEKIISVDEPSIMEEKPKAMLTKLWDKMNSFKPSSEEADIDTGHDYDGIRELDNITPPWFTTGLIATIIFAGVYLYRYQIAKTAPSQVEEYNIEMAQAEKAKSKQLVTKADIIDENSVTMLGVSDIEDGKKIFAQICFSCHEPHGGSKDGGIGPNLTDDYWIHGGSLADIFKSIKYGWPEKGMIAWQNNFSPKQMAQLSSFVKSIRGTKPAGAKEPQGELYVEKTAEVKDSGTIKK